MPPSTRRNRMLLLVFGTGLATGLHLGLLHVVLVRAWLAPVTFVIGLSRKLGTGTVSIDARVQGELLTLTVEDDGPGMTELMLGQVWDRGVGLRNLRDRLERLYGPEHRPVIESTPGRGTVFGGRYKLVMRDHAASEVAVSRSQARTLRARLRW